MENITLKKSMLDRYNELSAAHNYIFGYTENGNVYMSICDESILAYVIKLDKASRGAGYALRFKPTKAQKEIFRTEKTICLCSVAYFNDMVASSKYNKGETFEKMVTEYFSQIWTKDSVPFYMAGDININGIEYQIKFEGATFTNEKTLANIKK